ncbi:hypothetical protein D3C87_1944520 [compost metagenome]
MASSSEPTVSLIALRIGSTNRCRMFERMLPMSWASSVRFTGSKGFASFCDGLDLKNNEPSCLVPTLVLASLV